MESQSHDDFCVKPEFYTGTYTCLGACVGMMSPHKQASYREVNVWCCLTKNTLQLGEWIAIYIFCINLAHLARRERKPRVSKHLAVASSGTETDQNWAFQTVLSTSSYRSLGLAPSLYTDSLNPTAEWNASHFSLFCYHICTWKKEGPVSCNQSVYSASVMQVTPSEKFQNITPEALTYHADEIMKLLLSGSFYCFIWSTRNFSSTTEFRTSPLLRIQIWLCTGKCCHNQNQTFSRKTNHPPIQQSLCINSNGDLLKSWWKHNIP